MYPLFGGSLRLEKAPLTFSKPGEPLSSSHRHPLGHRGIENPHTPCWGKQRLLESSERKRAVNSPTTQAGNSWAGKDHTSKRENVKNTKLTNKTRRTDKLFQEGTVEGPGTKKTISPRYTRDKNES